MTQHQISPEFNLEATAYIVGAVGNYPRDFGPASYVVQPDVRDLQLSLPARVGQYLYLGLTLSGFKVVQDDWLSVIAALEDVNGSRIGTTRPALVYAAPYDVPVYTNFHVPEFGHVSLGLRVIGDAR